MPEPSPSPQPHLWEAEHPYYCSDSNYYAPGGDRPHGEPAHDHVEVESWSAFQWKDSDPDLNLLFRWDWSAPADYEGEDLPRETLVLFWMLQRKGRFMVTSMPIRRDEEPEVRAWIAERWKTIQALWAPVAEVSS